MKVFQVLNHRNQFCVEDIASHMGKTDVTYSFQSYATHVADLKVIIDENGCEDSVTYDNFWHDYSATTAKHLKAVLQMSSLAQRAVSLLLDHGSFKNFKDFMSNCKHFNMCESGSAEFVRVDYVTRTICKRLIVNLYTGEVYDD